MSSGYLSSVYAASLGEFGTPYQLSECGGWILKRPISNTPYQDAMGCYPFFDCRDWSKLHIDLRDLAGELVSFAMVTNPFAAFEPADLNECFPDVFFPYKEHFVADLAGVPEDFIDPHHQGCARKSLKKLHVEICDPPGRFLDDWVELYANLVRRHRIKGIPAFSRSSFELQFQVPELVLFRAVHAGKTVGMIMCYVQGENVYCHLGCYHPLGYKYMASYALVWTIIQHFKQQGLRRVNIGAGAGVKGNPEDGLNQFKKGWSNATKTVYFGGLILDPKSYKELVQARCPSATSYFPAYRYNEFVNI